MTKSPFFRYGSVILVSFCLVRFFWWLFPGLCSIWDLQVDDQIMRFAYERQTHHPVNPDIVHIDLDDQSVSSLIYDKNDPRLYTELIRVLKKAGVKTVLVDMVFPYCRKGREVFCDNFAEEVASSGNIYFPVILSTNDSQEKNDRENSWAISAERAIWDIPGAGAFDLKQGKVTLGNLAEISIAAAGLGHINSPPDHDGVYRHLPLIIDTGKGVIPSLALRAISGYLNVAPEQIHIPDAKNITLTNVLFPDGRNADITIPVDTLGQNRINFSGTWNNSFSHYSFATIIHTGATAAGLMDLTDELENTFAIVSDVSTGSRDFGPIPLASYFPLSGLHSHFINSVLENNFLHETAFSNQLALDVLLIALLTIIAVFLRGIHFTIAASALFASMLIAGMFLFMEQRFLVPMVRPSLSLILAVPAVMLMQFFEVQKEKQFIRGRLTHYFAPSLMEKILKEPEILNSVEKKELTILFSDIVGFTSWSSTQDAQHIHQTLNHYFEAMADIVFAHQGTIDKYMGDGLMVFFGDPLPLENHPLLAVQAAIAMQKKTRELRTEWEKTRGMPITIRIGIHTGEVVVGNMGSQNRMEYTIIGSNVNLAQRLESNCTPGRILFSEHTCKRLDNTVNIEPAGNIQAKGFSEPVSVYTVAEK